MIEGGSIARQIAMGLGAVVASEVPIFLRTIAVTGDDPLLGIRGTETITDVEFVPRPSIDCVGIKEIALSQGRLVEGDIRMVAAANRPLDEGAVIVYAGDEYRAVAVDLTRFGGVVVAYSCTLRKRIRVD